MHVLEEKLRAPELRVTQWLNSEPLNMAGLRGQVVLIDFWDYACINCLHTLPYLKEWHNRYAKAGLTIIGIHAPEFEFAHQAGLVQTAMETLGLTYPIALDNGFATWNAYANRAWPAKYLVDANGYIRAFHRGEGAYQAFERVIQQCLLELNPNQSFPEPMKPIRDMDQPGAACYRPTPELYLGYGRGVVGNPEGNPSDQEISYVPMSSDSYLPDTVYLDGLWLNRKEYIETVGELPHQVHLSYQAAEVNLVAGTEDGEPISVTVLLDGQPVPANDRGEDVALMDGQTVIQIDKPRMVRLIRHTGFERHRLTLAVAWAGLRAYAFTFVGCTTASSV
jgi:thiol-disulfide isomerase/thioredoxin